MGCPWESNLGHRPSLSLLVLAVNISLSVIRNKETSTPSAGSPVDVSRICVVNGEVAIPDSTKKPHAKVTTKLRAACPFQVSLVGHTFVPLGNPSPQIHQLENPFGRDDDGFQRIYHPFFLWFQSVAISPRSSSPASPEGNNAILSCGGCSALQASFPPERTIKDTYMNEKNYPRFLKAGIAILSGPKSTSLRKRNYAADESFAPSQDWLPRPRHACSTREAYNKRLVPAEVRLRLVTNLLSL
mmetsp:Transcript_17395/g.70548  ORF Transcript_17395/g.70548 Transcript_17395/m.70548 type:complete len:243 (-) Transcript_17395:1467-2195(-)